MSDTLNSAELRAEADALMASGLADLLTKYAPFEIVGSYATDLMAWRDLDIELYPDFFDLQPFLALGVGLGMLLKPVRLSFRDELQIRTPRNPVGLYWGVFLGEDRSESWKLDIWALDESHGVKRRERDARFIARLTPELRAAILGIKREVYLHPGFTKEFRSMDIYGAVLDHDVRTTAAFWDHLRGRGVTI